MPLRAIDLCAGAGGLSLGLQRAGFDVIGVEMDEDACATHRANVGPCEQASITEWHPSESADLVGGGVPCQGFSVAGKRGGSDLWREVIRIGQEANARSLIIENVRGMLSWRYDDGWGVVARIEEGMRAAGYEPRRALLCAADYGTPQLRYRLIIIAFRDPAVLARFSWPSPTHAELPGLFGLRPWVTVRDALGLGPGVRRAGLKEGASPADLQGMRLLDVDRPSPTVARVGELLDRPAPTITTVPDEVPDPSNPRRRPQAALRLAIASALDRPAPTVRANSGHEGYDAERASRRPMANVAAALETADEHAREGVVRLSLEHRAALQGFPPGFVWHGATAASRDKQVGNAVPPQLGEAVGRSVARALE